VPALAKPFEVADLIEQVRALSQREGKTPKTPTDTEEKSEDKAATAARSIGASRFGSLTSVGRKHKPQGTQGARGDRT